MVDPSRPRFAEISTAFPTVPESVAAARRFVAVSLRRFGFSDQSIEHATLATSELVANAFAADRPPIRIRVRSTAAGRATVEVTHGVDADVLDDRDADDEIHLTDAGRTVVESMVTRWGSRPVGAGVMAWFDITDDLPPTGVHTDTPATAGSA
jgi:hypothetical protein